MWDCVAGLVARSINQTSEFPGDSNRLTVVFGSSVAQEAGTRITISGLVTSRTPSGTLELTDLNGSDVSHFNLSAPWNKDTGTLVITVLRELGPGVIYHLAFNLANPLVPQDAAPVYISTKGSIALSDFLPVKMLHGPLNSAALLIIGWDERRIAQATPAASAQNTITVTFSTYGHLIWDAGRSTKVSIAGLRGANQTSSVVPITSDDDVFADEAAWNHTTSTLVFTIIKTTQAHYNYVLSFVLQNPDEGQDAPNPIELSAAWPIAPAAMSRGAGVLTPLLVHAFITKFLEQRDPSAGRNNTLILQLRSRSPLPASPSEVSIAAAGYGYVQGDLVVMAGAGTGFRAYFAVSEYEPFQISCFTCGSIVNTRILQLGSGYTNDADLTPVYHGTNVRMDKSITIALVVAAGQDYVVADVRATHEFSGSDFLAHTTVDESGAVTSLSIVDHGKDYGDAGYLRFVLFYPNTNVEMENSISGLSAHGLNLTAGCSEGDIITGVGGGGQDFRARIDAVEFASGAIVSFSIIYHGSGYAAPPQLVLSSPACKCNASAGHVPGSFDACITARRAHGISIGGRVAHDGVVKGRLPRVHLELPGVQNQDSQGIALMRHGFHYLDLTAIFGRYGEWASASSTLVLKFTGDAVAPGLACFTWCKACCRLRASCSPHASCVLACACVCCVRELSATATACAGATMQPYLNYSMEFYLQNPDEFQEGPPIWIRTTGLTSPRRHLDSYPRGHLRQALSIAGYALSAFVAQTNPAQNGSNLLQLELVPSITHPLAANVNLVAGGLHYLPGDIRILENGTLRDAGPDAYNATFVTDQDGRILQASPSPLPAAAATCQQLPLHLALDSDGA